VAMNTILTHWPDKCLYYRMVLRFQTEKVECVGVECLYSSVAEESWMFLYFFLLGDYDFVWLFSVSDLAFILLGS
jgi:hypothetical protein